LNNRTDIYQKNKDSRTRKGSAAKWSFVGALKLGFIVGLLGFFVLGIILLSGKV